MVHRRVGVALRVGICSGSSSLRDARLFRDGHVTVLLPAGRPSSERLVRGFNDVVIHVAIVVVWSRPDRAVVGCMLLQSLLLDEFLRVDALGLFADEGLLRLVGDLFALRDDVRLHPERLWVFRAPFAKLAQRERAIPFFKTLVS